MKKNKFYILLSILTVVFLFSFSAVCNQCAAATEEEEPVEEEAEEEEPAEEEKEPVEEEETTEEENEEEETEEEKVAEEDMVDPTIVLEVYEGPTYSSADDVCYWRVKAIVEGVPTPTVEFNRDDSGGAWGSKKAQINLNDPSETFTLTATAKNSKGEATDSIELSWECEGEELNNDPVINIMYVIQNEAHFYINSEASLHAEASDPDGDSLTYLWEVTGGTLDDRNSQNTTWTMPLTPGNYTVTLTVSDGRGGEDTKSVDKDVIDLVYDFMEEAPNAEWGTDWGDIGFGGLLDHHYGVAQYEYNVTLEDGIIYSRVLLTHPEWVDDGRIQGRYTDVYIPVGARFKAKVGLKSGADLYTDGVKFYVEFYDGSHYYFPSPSGVHCEYNASLDILDYDLSSIAGRTGSFYLRVSADGTSARDWFVWVDPRISK